MANAQADDAMRCRRKHVSALHSDRARARPDQARDHAHQRGLTRAVGLKLNADFVVLSACNTAAGDKPGAEALSGLARAFFYAGAKSLVVSHWEVDSEATVALMDGLFEALRADPHLSHAEALRMSMLRMLANSKKPELACRPLT
jgi:CHAT domain-containing protein